MSYPRIAAHATALAVLGGSLLTAEESVPYDTHAKDDSAHVAHVNANLNVNNGPQGQATAGPTTTVVFSGSSYTNSTGIVSPTTTRPEAEEHIACDPNTPATLIAAISDFGANRVGLAGYNTTKYVISTNNGVSWTESFVPFNSGTGKLLTGDQMAWDANSDPVVAIDRNGNAYLANLYFDAKDNANGVYVSVGSSAAGFSVAGTYPVAVNPSLTTTVDEDKEWIAVDNSTSAFTGTVYLVWTRFIGNSDMILLSRSSDHGQHWSTPIQISPTAQNGAVQGSQVAVGPDGSVYVAYHVAFTGNRGKQYLSVSHDGGSTFSAAAAITPLFNELTFNSTYRKNSFPALAIGASGVVCIAYADQPSNSLGAQVEFIRSTNGGASFSSPAALNNVSTGHQFMPALAADASGVLYASWFDTRNASGSSRYDIYSTRSTDGGATFGANLRVTPTTISAGNASFIGDYAGISGGAPDPTTGAPTAHPVWTSGGFNGGALQTTSLAAVPPTGGG
jgi:hypothetical protein